jgi:two-component system chemotaxis response regulator CheB
MMKVQIASQGDQLEVGTVYLGAPDDHLTLAARCLGTMTSDPMKLHRNRTIDLLFKSIAENGGPRTIGVVLSGSLDDGSRGLAAMHDAGGLTMVMEPSHDRTGGMPENAIHFDGPIDKIGSAEEIAAAIIRTVSRQPTSG